MKKLHLFAAAVILTTAAAASTAQAMPAAPGGLRQGSPVIQADWACGRGFHMTRWGNCRPNWEQPRWRRPPPRFYDEYERPRPRYYPRYERPAPRFYDGY